MRVCNAFLTMFKPMMRVYQNQGYLLGSPHNKDFSILGSMYKQGLRDRDLKRYLWQMQGETLIHAGGANYRSLLGRRSLQNTCSALDLGSCLQNGSTLGSPGYESHLRGAPENHCLSTHLPLQYHEFCCSCFVVINGGFLKSGVFCGVPICKDYSILGSILRFPYFGKLPKSPKRPAPHS